MTVTLVLSTTDLERALKTGKLVLVASEAKDDASHSVPAPKPEDSDDFSDHRASKKKGADVSRSGTDSTEVTPKKKKGVESSDDFENTRKKSRKPAPSDDEESSGGKGKKKSDEDSEPRGKKARKPAPSDDEDSEPRGKKSPPSDDDESSAPKKSKGKKGDDVSVSKGKKGDDVSGSKGKKRQVSDDEESSNPKSKKSRKAVDSESDESLGGKKKRSASESDDSIPPGPRPEKKAKPAKLVVGNKAKGGKDWDEAPEYFTFAKGTNYIVDEDTVIGAWSKNGIRELSDKDVKNVKSKGWPAEKESESAIKKIMKRLRK